MRFTMRKKFLRSRSGFEKPESREEAIMQNILGASNVLEPAESNIEEILQAILYNTPYTKEAESEIEKILLAIKNNGTYDGEGESRDMKILIAILNDLDYTEGAQSRIEELFIEWLYQRSSIKVLEGVPPLTFTSKGQPLLDYLISGNTVQNGTPTPDNPVMPEGTGDLETIGAKAGQYKIPISSARQTTPVYLGEVETTRKIKKLVLDGTEAWRLYEESRGAWQFYSSNIELGGVTKSSAMSNIAPYGINTDTRHNYDYGCYLVSSGKSVGFQMKGAKDTFTNVGAWKAYLQHQYANGTPVTVWYVLATPETGIVNEPLMKIGEYADSISKTQAGVEIPTVNGSNTLDVDTTLKPSNVYIEYK